MNMNNKAKEVNGILESEKTVYRNTRSMVNRFQAIKNGSNTCMEDCDVSASCNPRVCTCSVLENFPQKSDDVLLNISQQKYKLDEYIDIAQDSIESLNDKDNLNKFKKTLRQFMFGGILTVSTVVILCLLSILCDKKFDIQAGLFVGANVVFSGYCFITFVLKKIGYKKLNAAYDKFIRDGGIVSQRYQNMYNQFAEFSGNNARLITHYIKIKG